MQTATARSALSSFADVNGTLSTPTTDIDGNAIIGAPGIGTDEVPRLLLSETSNPENSDLSTSVGTFSTRDADPLSSFTYELVDSSSFSENSSLVIDGQILRTASALNFEATNQYYEVRIRVTGLAGPPVEKTYLIDMTDVNGDRKTDSRDGFLVVLVASGAQDSTNDRLKFFNARTARQIKDYVNNTLYGTALSTASGFLAAAVVKVAAGSQLKVITATNVDSSQDTTGNDADNKFFNRIWRKPAGGSRTGTQPVKLFKGVFDLDKHGSLSTGSVQSSEDLAEFFSNFGKTLNPF